MINPIQKEGLKCSVKGCSQDGASLIQSKCFCKEHLKELKVILKKFGVKLIK
jgi:phosphoribosylamine-glycine ligase